jgi:hypothetical protein
MDSETMPDPIDDQINRMEAKLDRLIAVWEEFEPFLRQAHVLMNMSPADKVKTLLKGKRNGVA